MPNPAGSIVRLYFWDAALQVWLQDVQPRFKQDDELRLIAHCGNPSAVSQRMTLNFYITYPKGDVDGVVEQEPMIVSPYQFGVFGEYQALLKEVGTYKIELVLLSEVVE